MFYNKISSDVYYYFYNVIEEWSLNQQIYNLLHLLAHLVQSCSAREEIFPLPWSMKNSIIYRFIEVISDSVIVARYVYSSDVPLIGTIIIQL